MQTIEPIARAVEAFASLPGIGPKTAQRLTFHLLRQPPEAVRELAEAITNMQAAVHFCSVCGNVTDVEPCSICRSDQRDQATICVVEDPLAVITLERTRSYRGLYHVLHGALDPLHGITVEDLKIEELVRRVEGGTVREVILATNPNVEGDTTAGYLERRLAPLGVHVTRLARGLPVGGDLEYADEVTLARALEGRRASL
ncbi:MAG: recombination protein RecR [Chloroflexi bacterium]|nr:recombination protein RecR [Chloroflexota bacterium]MBV9599942.1 recombination protein RecR [Chloroflexota bacterium]